MNESDRNIILEEMRDAYRWRKENSVNIMKEEITERLVEIERLEDETRRYEAKQKQTTQPLDNDDCSTTTVNNDESDRSDHTN